MPRHLDDTERIDALEGALPAARRAHLDECSECRHALLELRAVSDEVRAGARGDVPEPSPLFWNHFHRRVATAVDEGAAAGVVRWWQGSTRAWMGLAAAAVVVLAAMTVVPRSGTPVAGPQVPDQQVAAVADDDDVIQWQFVTDVLDTLEPETAHAVLGPSAGAVDAAFTMLTAAEREAFARLLQAQMSEGSD